MDCPKCGFATDDASEMFQHLGQAYSEHRFASAPEVIVDALGSSYKRGFPELEGNFDVAGLDVEVKAAKRGAPRREKSAAHRIYVTCPTCNKKIPAGRIHQHVVVHNPTMSCVICHRSFGSRQTMRSHMRMAHGRR